MRGGDRRAVEALSILKVAVGWVLTQRRNRELLGLDPAYECAINFDPVPNGITPFGIVAQAAQYDTLLE